MAQLLGALDASHVCHGLVLYVDGLGSPGGGGASLALHAWQLARALGAKAIVLKTRLGLSCVEGWSPVNENQAQMNGLERDSEEKHDRGS